MCRKSRLYFQFSREIWEELTSFLENYCIWDKGKSRAFFGSWEILSDRAPIIILVKRCTCSGTQGLYTQAGLGVECSLGEGIVPIGCIIINATKFELQEYGWSLDSSKRMGIVVLFAAILWSHQSILRQFKTMWSSIVWVSAQYKGRIFLGFLRCFQVPLRNYKLNECNWKEIRKDSCMKESNRSCFCAANKLP